MSEQVDADEQISNRGIKFDLQRCENSFARMGGNWIPVEIQNLRNSFEWPLLNGEIIQYFGEKEERAYSMHDAIDIKAPIGTDITAPLGGELVVIEDQERNKEWGVLLGDVYIYDRKTGLLQQFCHLDLEDIRTRLKEGQVVETGQVIGKIGKFEYDDFSDPHLHYGIEYSRIKGFLVPLAQAQRINPLLLLKELRSVRDEENKERKVGI